MNKHRYKLLTGPHAGEIFDGQGCNARPHPNGPVDISLGDGVFITALNLRLPLYVGNAKNTDFEDMATPFDKNGDEIFVGTEIVYPMASGGAGGGAQFVVGKVVKINNPTHRGYGYYTRQLTVEPQSGGKKFPVPYPSNCLIATPNPGGGYNIKL